MRPLVVGLGEGDGEGLGEGDGAGLGEGEGEGEGLGEGLGAGDGEEGTEEPGGAHLKTGLSGKLGADGSTTRHSRRERAVRAASGAFYL